MGLNTWCPVGGAVGKGYVWSTGRHVLIGGSASQGRALRVYSLVPLLLLSLICVCGWGCDQSASCCSPPAATPAHHYGLIRHYQPKLPLPSVAFVQGISSQQQKSN